MNNSTEVFYYCYIPPDLRSTAWTWFIDQQLGVIKQSRLHDFAKINVFVCGPLYWTSLDPPPTDSTIARDNADTNYQEIFFYEKIIEYITYRYPFVSNIIFRDTGEDNIHEGFPLQHLYTTCKNKNVNVLYFHSKGATRGIPSIATWRECLNEVIVADWKKCITALEEHDVVAVADSMSSNGIVSGNYFWSKSSYIKTLENPIETMLYTSPELVSNNVPVRYRYENWILSNRPKVFWAADTKVDHYASYCFIENLNLCRTL